MKLEGKSLYPLLAAGTASAFDCTPQAFEKCLPSTASVTFAHSVAAGSTFNIPAGDIAYPTSPTNLDALCAVEVKVVSSNSSAYSFGLFLPEDWNNRFLFVASIHIYELH